MGNGRHCVSQAQFRLLGIRSLQTIHQLLYRRMHGGFVMPISRSSFDTLAMSFESLFVIRHRYPP